MEAWQMAGIFTVISSDPWSEG